MLITFSVVMGYSQTIQSYPVRLKIATYTYPKHHEVVQDHLGICPKCDMKLVDNIDMSKNKVNLYNNSTIIETSLGENGSGYFDN